jgi:hypothetical protein
VKPSLVIVVLLVITAQRAPAPIQEILESPTPAPTVAPTAKLKPKASKNEAAQRESPRAQSQRAQTTPRPQAIVGQRRIGQFAGTWIGTVMAKNPLIGVGLHKNTFVVNNEENSITETGPVGTFTHRATLNGNTLSFKTGVFKEVLVTLSLIGDGRTAQVNVDDKIWGRCSGEVKKQN